MIRQVIQLTGPGVFLPRFAKDDWPEDNILVRPTYLSICAADQRYFTGERPERLLRDKLPMALLHEAVGEILHDPEGRFSCGDKVVLVPCAGEKSENGIFPNYAEKSRFHSSTCDGFAQEFLPLPRSQALTAPADEKIYVFAEMMSVCVHAITRWRTLRGDSARQGRIGIWGDGPLGYILALTLTVLEPESDLVVFGKHDEKLAFFSFADAVVNVAARRRCRVDCAFECVGGEGAGQALKDITERIRPQGMIFLLGVSEHDPCIHTRVVLEKGLTLVGCSRSSAGDFAQAVRIIHDASAQDSLQKIISEEMTIRNAKDLEKAFRKDREAPFKSVLEWAV